MPVYKAIDVANVSLGPTFSWLMNSWIFSLLQGFLFCFPFFNWGILCLRKGCLSISSLDSAQVNSELRSAMTFLIVSWAGFSLSMVLVMYSPATLFFTWSISMFPIHWMNLSIFLLFLLRVAGFKTLDSSSRNLLATTERGFLVRSAIRKASRTESWVASSSSSPDHWGSLLWRIWLVFSTP